MTATQEELPLEAGPTGIDAILAETAQNIDDLYRAASAPGAPPPWSDLLNRIAKSTHMAPFNLMLADIQRPGARFVAFADKWREIGREVKPGAIPIIVLWPFGPVRCAYDLSDTTGPDDDDALLQRVFGEPLEVKGDAAVRLARRSTAEDNVDVRFLPLGSNRAGDAQSTGAEPATKGRPAEPRWVVRINSQLNDGAQITTLIHELAHIYLGHLGGNGKKWPNRRPDRIDVREFEAEAVSFIVGRRFGLNTSSAEYLHGYVKGDTIEHVSFSAVARAAGRIEQHAR